MVAVVTIYVLLMEACDLPLFLLECFTIVLSMRFALTLHSRSQFPLSYILVVWDIFQRRFHGRTLSHGRELCDIGCGFASPDGNTMCSAGTWIRLVLVLLLWSCYITSLVVGRPQPI